MAPEHEDVVMGHARHFDIKGGERSHRCVEVIAQADVDVADLILRELEVAPHCEGLEELLYSHEEPCDGGLDGGLKGWIRAQSTQGSTGTCVCWATRTRRRRRGRVGGCDGVVVTAGLVSICSLL